MKRTLFTGLLLWTLGMLQAQYRVSDIHISGSSYPLNLTPFNGQLFFTATHPLLGMEPFMVDSMGNVQMIADVNQGAGNSFAEGYTVFKDQMYFVAMNVNEDFRLWRYSPAGLTSVPAPIIQQDFFVPRSGHFQIIDDQMILAIGDGPLNYGIEPYRYNGFGSLQLIADVNYGFSSSSPQSFVEMGGKWYFVANTHQYGTELFEHDPTTGSTQMVQDLRIGSPSGIEQGFTGDLEKLVVFNDRVYFSGKDAIHGWNLRAYDGDTLISYFLNPTGLGSPFNLTVFKDALYFMSRDSVNNPILNRVDKSGDVTEVAQQGFMPGFIMGDTYVYPMNDGIHGTELWVFDGVNPPSMVIDLNPGTGNGVSNFTVMNHGIIAQGKLYFAGNDGIHGDELWVYDGINPPAMVMDIQPGPLGSLPREFAVMGSKIFFSADDGQFGRELWAMDLQTVSNDAEIESSIVMYPNPAQDWLSIESANPVASVSIFDLSGKLIHQYAQASDRVFLGNLKTGSYVIEATLVNGHSVRRMIVKR
ncbi:T9SS type A sorting domain-containing protein [Pontibacter sp. G13]|uniref:T9SS type A sorting domain-containing protein n=1 Tax=Pontibacter sp. G13 TaxID=3074898 RepID=UPI00288B6AE1|nr:T9SS type A sorting domain-containing protein [Pontibacter sp. G13]WNJ17691.1 T9SS type A sorting domain-containing protein [Pontibacter sp. G13]